ncbi:MAG: tRNA pseudouridine(13) synthase TruD [Planctomycetota bacterium]
MNTSIDTSPRVIPARYMTDDLPGIGGVLKERPEDFIVEEIPLYEPSGEGEHIYLFVEKREMTGLELVGLLARHFGVKRGAIGYAGMKDKIAVTRQVISIHTPGKKIEDFPSLEHAKVRVMWADYHANKLRRGHLAGNRFSIRVRGVSGATAALTANRVMRVLAREGVPDRFGGQRFGYLCNNHMVGRAMVSGAYADAMKLLLGPSARSPAYHAEAREHARAGRWAAARDAFPKGYRTERLVADALAKGATAEQAIRSLDTTVLGFYVSALQSAVFNRVLDERVTAGTAGELVVGDIAAGPGGNGRVPVTDGTLADTELDLAGKLGRFELSPSGPLWGTTMDRAAGAVGEAEIAALAGVGLTPDDLAGAERLESEMSGGSRRPLRIGLKDIEVEGGMDEHGSFVRCAFDLPRGAFATTVLGEVMKPERTGVEPGGTRDDAEDDGTANAGEPNVDGYGHADYEPDTSVLEDDGWVIE